MYKNGFRLVDPPQHFFVRFDPFTSLDEDNSNINFSNQKTEAKVLSTECLSDANAAQLSTDLFLSKPDAKSQEQKLPKRLACKVGKLFVRLDWSKTVLVL